MNEELELLRKQLDYLVDKAVQARSLSGITDYFVSEKIKGIRLNIDSCILSRYLTREIGTLISVDGANAHITTEGNHHHISLPVTLRMLVYNFDQGAYPYLEEPA